MCGSADLNGSIMAPHSKLTPEVREKLLAATRDGATLKDASAYAGVSVDSLARYREKDMALRDAFQRAEGTAAVGYTRVLKAAADAGDWRPALEWLKRRRPDEWGDKQKIETSGPDGGRIEMHHVHEIDPELLTTEELEMMRRVALRIEGKTEDG